MSIKYQSRASVVNEKRESKCCSSSVTTRGDCKDKKCAPKCDSIHTCYSECEECGNPCDLLSNS